jgi:hypothetical protein
MDVKNDDISNATATGRKNIPGVIPQTFTDWRYDATPKRLKAKRNCRLVLGGVEHYIENSSCSVFERRMNRNHKSIYGSNPRASGGEQLAQ